MTTEFLLTRQNCKKCGTSTFGIKNNYYFIILLLRKTETCEIKSKDEESKMIICVISYVSEAIYLIFLVS